VYVESICVRNVRLEAVGNKVTVKLAQGESDRILPVTPRFHARRGSIVKWRRGLGIQLEDLLGPAFAIFDWRR
jgi:hypothetical protein